MRTVFGATALAVGGCMAILTMLASAVAPVWMIWVGVGLTSFFLVTSLFLLRRKRDGGARRWPVVVGALSAGLIGLILGVYTSNSGIQALGDQYVHNEGTGSHELIKGGYDLNVRLFDKVVYQQIGPAVTQTGPRGDSTGPSDRLLAVMLVWGWSMVATYVLLFGWFGAALGAGIDRLAQRSR